ncbi:MAG: Rieske 2Fe-2S domain-containing protein [Gammaproteobacteria bacterium]|nr:Rieske 2Fe-2S domain-containing protein [Gammaproteobacteria bacterium]
MVMKKSKAQLIERLKIEGFDFSEFSLINEGVYSVSDADWNYKDIPHLHYVHRLAEAAPSYASDDQIASIVVQKIPGFTIPLSVFIYENTPTSQLYYTANFFFILIVESVYTELEPNRTRVTTTYSIGSAKWLKWTFPMLRWLIKRNYRDLMSTDIPMRERRGQLRNWGYEFHNDAPTYSYAKSVNIRPDNVILPVKQELPDHCITLKLDENLPKEGEFFWGKDDAWGLRLVRTSDKLRMFARMCHHEGASLDKEPCVNHKLQCPWHGRKSLPIATFDLAQTDNQEAESRLHHISFADGLISIKLQSISAKTEPQPQTCTANLSIEKEWAPYEETD